MEVNTGSLSALQTWQTAHLHEGEAWKLVRNRHIDGTVLLLLLGNVPCLRDRRRASAATKESAREGHDALAMGGESAWALRLESRSRKLTAGDQLVRTKEGMCTRGGLQKQEGNEGHK